MHRTKRKPCLLIIDDFSAHKIECIIDYMNNNNIKSYLIPCGYTYCLQPLDVSINKPFKDSMRRLYNNWNIDSNRFSVIGVKSRPSWQQLTDMVEKATNEIKSSNIRKSFLCCGFNLTINVAISAFKSSLNGRLRDILSFPDDIENRTAIENKIKLIEYDYAQILETVEEITPQTVYHSSRDYRDSEVNSAYTQAQSSYDHYDETIAAVAHKEVNDQEIRCEDEASFFAL